MLMKKIFTLLVMALMAVGVNAQTQLTLGGQSAAGKYSWGWTQTFGASANLYFSSQWGEFNLATEGLTEGAAYKLVVAEPNAKVNLRINAESAQYIAVDKTELTGTVPAGTTSIELQATEAGQDLNVVSFTINDVQTAYATNWGVAMKGGNYTSTGQWAELMLNGAEGKAGQDITITANAAIPEGLTLKAIYSDDSESYPAVTAGGTVAKIYLEKPLKQVSLQAAVGDPVNIDIASVVASFGVWTVAGSGTLLGTSWDTENTDNDMTTTDGITYTLVKENVVLEAGVAQTYKVLKDHAWDVNYGANGVSAGDNVTLTVNETATYTVTFTFDSQTHVITAEAVKTGSGEVGAKTYSVIGWGGDWETDIDMVKGDDGLYTATISNVAAGSYEFKIRVNHDWSENYGVNGAVNGDNIPVTVSENGSDVTITFNAESDPKAITVKVSVATGIATAKVVDLKQAVRYNLAGQQVTEAYKGVVIMNGRKIVVK